MANPIDIPQNFSTTLNVGGGITNSQTTGIILTSVSGLPTDGGILCIDWASTLDTAVAEYIEYTGISGNELTGVTRGQEGLSAKAHSNGATIVGVVSRQHIKRLRDKLTGNDATAIQDPNGNEIVKTSYAASAVNEVTLTNAATGNPPSISATGGDTNIDLKLLPKGTGVLTVTGTTNYETNVTDDDDIPNKKYVDDSSSTDGWISSADTWVYASASTFTIAGVDRTTIYQKGARLRFKQGGGYKYAIVKSSAFSTDTTVTIFINTDYTIANAAITDNDYSYQISPQGFLGWFSFTTTFTGFSADPSTTTIYYQVNGKMLSFYYIDGTDGTSNSTGLTFTVPAPYKRSQNNAGFITVKDNGTHQTVLGHLVSSASSATVSAYKQWSQGTFTNSGAKNLFIPVTSYEWE